jgi:glucosamine--fructose-6-phosphate aminotransferase (isomerizing)
VAVSEGRLTEQEIRAQPGVWAETLEALPISRGRLLEVWRSAPAHRVLLTGCGSSYYLALSAAHLLQSSLHVPCHATPSSEVLFAEKATYWASRPPLVVAISRSGETTETVWALERLQGWGATAVALTCREGGALSRASDLSITVPVDERSVVMTASFTSMLLALAAVGATLSGDLRALDVLRRAPDHAAADLPVLGDRAETFADPAAGLYAYLGSTALYGVACEGALKMTEMALLPGCAYHTLEFLHGPKAAVSSQTVAIGLLSPAGMPFETRVLTHLAGLGATVITVGDRAGDLPAVPLSAEPGTVPALLIAVMWMQLLALAVARRRGVDPDAPRFLDPVVTWDASLQIGGAR